MALEVNNTEVKTGKTIVPNNESKSSVLININRLRSSNIIKNNNHNKKLSNTGSNVCANRRAKRFGAADNHLFNFLNTDCRSKSDKNKVLSLKVVIVRDRSNGHGLAADNSNTHCQEREIIYDCRCLGEAESRISCYEREINADVIREIKNTKNGGSGLTKCENTRKVMIAGSLKSNDSEHIYENNESVLKNDADAVRKWNAQNFRDDRLPPVGKRSKGSFDLGENYKHRIVREDRGKMSFTSESSDVIDNGSNYNLISSGNSQSRVSNCKNNCTKRTTRSAESTPEIFTGCKTIARSDKSPGGFRPRCKLNENNCLSLNDILRSFNGPISEEQAWALCYQCAKCFEAAIRNRTEIEPHTTNNEKLYDVTELDHVLLHKDGDVHSTTIRDPRAQPDSREPYTSEHKLVFSLGLIVFGALDFGLDEEEERRVAPDLEALITLMTQPADDESEAEERLQETDDEGIERDSGESEDDPLHQTPDPHGIHPDYIRRNTPPHRLRPSAPCSVNTVLQLCTRHLQGTQEQADTHYKAVVRALVAEALELSHFLEKVAADKQENSSSSVGVNAGDRHLDTLDFSDWARFWVQVIGELRRGVKLKKVEGSIGGGGGTGSGSGINVGGKRSVRGTGRGIEFELTPYEILMDDIRARRYRLRKTPSPSPAHLRKDAHAVILDFIRSRPPLKKASERKLPPLKRQSTPRELLMESIKRPPRPLRPSSAGGMNKIVSSEYGNLQTTPTRNSASGSGARDDPTATSNTELVTTPKSSRREAAESTNAPRYQPRRLIIPLDFKLDGEDDDDDDDDDVVTRFDDDGADSWRDEGDDDDIDEGNIGQKASRPGESANPWRRTGGLRLTRNEYHRFCDTQLESYDLATQCPSRRVSSRRHTVVGSTGAGLGSGAGTLSLPHSRPQSRQQEPQNRRDTSANVKPKDRGLLEAEFPSSVKSSQDELTQEKSPNKGNASIGNMFLDDRLSLTLEEIVHIRSVLTKAELESLPVEGHIKEDVEKRRVCFLCLKTKFGIFGPWGQRCRLCERTVCVKCYSKMRIPTEHFAHVPVVLLSPSLMLSPPSEVDGKDYSSPSHGTVRSLWPRPAGGVGSAPASPASKRRDPTLRNTTPTPTPTPSVAGSSHQEDEGAACNSLPPSNNSPAQNLDKSRRFYCSSANSSPARTSGSSSRYGGAGDLRVAERLRGVAMVVCHDCRIMVLQIIKSSRTTRATIRNNVISRLTLNLSPIYV